MAFSQMHSSVDDSRGSLWFRRRFCRVPEKVLEKVPGGLVQEVWEAFGAKPGHV